jgi:adenosylhomocysteine nucleosidase
MNHTSHNERLPVALLICFAVKEEAAFALPLPIIKGGREMLITGMGRRNTSTRFNDALARLSPERVLTCGFAGALNPEFRIGDVLFDEDFDAGFGEKLRSLGASSAKFYCSTRVATTVAEKVELRRTTGGDAVEMESAVIRTICREHKIPSATVRVISDTANEDLPLDFNALMTSEQKISIVKLASTLVKSPTKVPRLLNLQRNTRFAARRLAEVLTGLLRALRCDGGVCG